MGDELTRTGRLAAQVIAANRMIGEIVAAALRDVPRHFPPEPRPDLAYTDDAIVTKRDESGQADQLVVPARHDGHHAG